MAKQSDKKQKARTLFLTGEYAQKEIASICGVSEKTITEWKKEDNWEDHKMSLLTTRENELRRLYRMLQNINDFIEEKAADKIPINSKEADSVLKLTAAIQKLEVETSIAEKVEVGTEFIRMVRQENADLAKEITHWFDIYLQSKFK